MHNSLSHKRQNFTKHTCKCQVKRGTGTYRRGMVLPYPAQAHHSPRNPASQKLHKSYLFNFLRKCHYIGMTDCITGQGIEFITFHLPHCAEVRGHSWKKSLSSKPAFVSPGDQPLSWYHQGLAQSITSKIWRAACQEVGPRPNMISQHHVSHCWDYAMYLTELSCKCTFERFYLYTE